MKKLRVISASTSTLPGYESHMPIRRCVRPSADARILAVRIEARIGSESNADRATCAGNFHVRGCPSHFPRSARFVSWTVESLCQDSEVPGPSGDTYPGGDNPAFPILENVGTVCPRGSCQCCNTKPCQHARLPRVIFIHEVFYMWYFGSEDALQLPFLEPGCSSSSTDLPEERDSSLEISQTPAIHATLPPSLQRPQEYCADVRRRLRG